MQAPGSIGPTRVAQTTRLARDQGSPYDRDLNPVHQTRTISPLTPASSFSSSSLDLSFPQPSGQPMQYQHASLLCMQIIESLTSMFKLADNEREQLYKFSQESDANQLIILFAHILINNKTLNDMKGTLSGITSMLDKISMNTRLAWSLTDAQDKTLRRVIRHWLIKPINAYGRPVNRAVEEYIRKNAQKSLQLDNYRADVIIQQTVHDFVATFQNSHRSNLRKKVFTSVKNGQSLQRFANKLINLDYEGKDPDEQTIKAIHAQVALMRIVARPLAKKRGRKGGNTGFWEELNARLRRLVKENGAAREGEKWATWYDQIIKEDNDAVGAAGDHVMSEDEDEGANSDLEFDERGATDILGSGEDYLDAETVATAPAHVPAAALTAISAAVMNVGEMTVEMAELD